MKKSILTLLLLSIIGTFFSACSSHKEKEPSHRSDDILWQQYRSDEAVKSLDD